MSLKKEIKETLEKYNLQPRKYFGQNFLIEKGTLNKILETAGLKKTDTILEVGSGPGTLTKELAKKVKKVIAIEKDKRLARVLSNELKTIGIKNIKVINNDILELTTNDLQLKNKNYKVVANLPYYITSPVIRKFLEEKNPPDAMVLMVQKEVAGRICISPPKMSILSVAVQLYSKPKIIKIVKKDSFWPKPKVDSAILKIENINSENFSLQFRLQFFKIVKAGFSSPRKQLKNNLKKMFKDGTKKALEKSDIDGRRRAESISIKEWILLAKNFKKL